MVQDRREAHLEMEHYRFSKFVHFLNLGTAVAIYNSLNLALVYVTPRAYSLLAEACLSMTCELRNEVVEPIKDLVDRLVGQRILVRTDENELDDYLYWRTVLPTLPIGVLYLLLTDNCNFACNYCVIEGGMPQDSRRSFMSVATAKKAIDLFARHR